MHSCGECRITKLQIMAEMTASERRAYADMEQATLNLKSLVRQLRKAQWAHYLAARQRLRKRTQEPQP